MRAQSAIFGSPSAASLSDEREKLPPDLQAAEVLPRVRIAFPRQRLLQLPDALVVAGAGKLKCPFHGTGTRTSRREKQNSRSGAVALQHQLASNIVAEVNGTRPVVDPRFELSQSGLTNICDQGSLLFLRAKRRRPAVEAL